MNESPAAVVSMGRSMRSGGNGAFHKEHEAVYTDDALARSAHAWAIMGVSLRSPRVLERMAPQDGLYTVIERGAAAERLRVIGAITEVAFAPADPASAVPRRLYPHTVPRLIRSRTL